MIEWATAPVEWVDPESFIFVVLQQHVDEFAIDVKPRDRYGDAITVVRLDGMTDGAAETVLAARAHLSAEPLIVLFGDQYIQAPVRRVLEQTDADGTIATFNSTDPGYSYARTDNGRVTEVAEKEVISSNATAGLYYFERGTDFVEGAERMIEKNIRTNGLFYVCPVYNQLIEMGKRIEVFEVDEMWSLGDPTAVERFEQAEVR
ncbi:glycosyl transferase family 2 [Halovenus sp. WSH3]|uniref:Glycosyl transferase family 2 n=2 Tax=Halovenus carboxidivorans TaxID=2692199 RepID=A0A6B0SYX8_9EURY|nr:glycosyl transferase family 2 [Halovenus carboxidivorans]